MRTILSVIIGGFVMAGTSAPADTDISRIVYLSDIVYGIQRKCPDLMGKDTTPYVVWPKYELGSPLKIKDQVFSKGLGIPSPNEVILMLDKEFAHVDGKVGLQSGTAGNVIFQLVADGKTVYDSGQMTPEDDPRSFSIPVAGIDELKLITVGGGTADWVDVKLTSSNSTSKKTIDMAKFALVKTFDPDKTNSMFKSYLEAVVTDIPFPAEEVFPGTEVALSKDGSYHVPEYKDGRKCIGLEWIEQRRIKELGIRFAKGSDIPSPDGVRVESWEGLARDYVTGESGWQGKWKLLSGNIECDGDKWTFRVSDETRKIRWIFPKSTKPVFIKELNADTHSQEDIADIMFQLKEYVSGKYANVEIYNGGFVKSNDDDVIVKTRWNLDSPLRLKVKYTRQRPWGSDRTVIRIDLPSGKIAVAIDDLLPDKFILYSDKEPEKSSFWRNNDDVVADLHGLGCVYIPELGFFASAYPGNISFDNYLAKIKERKTILEQVRKMPDQTMDQALKLIYNPRQNNTPNTTISLAWDDRKVNVDRTGGLHYGPEFPDVEKFSRRYEMKPQFGTDQNTDITRKLDNGWMPIPHISLNDNGLIYEQSTFVAPFNKDADANIPWQINKQPLCVVEYKIINPQDIESSAAMKFSFISDFKARTPANVVLQAGQAVASFDNILLGAVDIPIASGFSAVTDEGTVTISGMISPKSEVKFYAYVPLWETEPSVNMLFKDGDNLRKDTEAYWKKIMSPAIQIDIPDKLLQNLIIASQVHCINASRSGKGGVLVDPWIAATYYASIDSESQVILKGMDGLGNHEYVKRGLDYWISKYNAGGFLTATYTYGAGVGQHLLALGEYYKFTKDKEWLKENASEISRLCRYISNQVQKTKRLDASGKKVPEYGLMTPGRTADWGHWGYSFFVSGYSYQGLLSAAQALADIDYPDSDNFMKTARDMKKDIRRAFQWAQARTPAVPLRDGTWTPGFPFEVYTPGALEQFFTNLGVDIYEVIVGSHHLGPHGILDANGKELGRVQDHLEDIQNLKLAFPSWGEHEYNAAKEKDWFNWGGLSKGQPYYLRNLELFAMQDDVKPFIRAYINTAVTSICLEDLTFWENTWGRSVPNKTAETGEFLNQSRLLFVMEKGNDLWLAPFITNQWMHDGEYIDIKNAPTYFGDVSYKITSNVNKGLIEAIIESPDRKAPKNLVIRFRHPNEKLIKSVVVNGKPYDNFDPEKEIIKLKPSKKTITVQAYYK